MALLQRVSSMETFSPERSLSPVSSRSRNIDDDLVPRNRKLSFSPMPGNWDGHSIKHGKEIENAIGAYEVSKGKRILQVFIAVIYCFLATGIVFGFAAIKPVLIQEQVYRDLCTQDELDADVRVCYQQELRLNLMFTIAAVGTNVAALPIGAILDTYGPRVCGIIGSILLTIGSLLFSFAWQLSFDAYIPGYLFLALGGPFIFISSFQLSNTFPKHSGLILALLTGAFDCSSAVFLIYRLIYQWSDGTFWPKKFFLCYLVVPVFILLVQIFIMPALSYKSVGELIKQAEDSDSIADDQMDEHTALLREERRERRESVISEITSLLGTKTGGEQIAREEKKNARSGIWGAMHGKTVRQQVMSPWFVLITLFTVVQMTRINYFVATIRTQYEQILGSYAEAVAVNTFFDVALPLGGLCAVPFIGVILDNTSTTFVLSTLVTTATTIGVLGVLPYTWAAYANVCLFVLYRPFYYTSVSDYSAKVFGFRTFGTVYGFIICLAGLFNFSQSGLDALTHRTFHNNPVPVNILLLSVALVIGIALIGYVAYRAHNLEREHLQEEADMAVEEPVPGSALP